MCSDLLSVLNNEDFCIHIEGFHCIHISAKCINLAIAHACSGRWDYELYLSYDLYTNKHTQWFYFSVRNMRKGQTYRFTIVNLYKVKI